MKSFFLNIQNLEFRSNEEIPTGLKHYQIKWTN